MTAERPTVRANDGFEKDVRGSTRPRRRRRCRWRFPGRRGKRGGGGGEEGAGTQSNQTPNDYYRIKNGSTANQRQKPPMYASACKSIFSA